jgi:hypothetical protein
MPGPNRSPLGRPWRCAAAEPEDTGLCFDRTSSNNSLVAEGRQTWSSEEQFRRWSGSFHRVTSRQSERCPGWVDRSPRRHILEPGDRMTSRARDPFFIDLFSSTANGPLERCRYRPRNRQRWQVVDPAIVRERCRVRANPNRSTPHSDSTVIIDRIPPVVKTPPSGITRPRPIRTGNRVGIDPEEILPTTRTLWFGFCRGWNRR